MKEASPYQSRTVASAAYLLYLGKLGEAPVPYIKLALPVPLLIKELTTPFFAGYLEALDDFKHY